MKYLLGSKKEFFDFVNSISKKDKIGIFTHTDLDGIASAVFIEEILKSKGLKIDFIEFLEYRSGVFKQSINNRQVDKLFVCDLNLDEFPDEFKLIKSRCNVFLIDHHLFAENLKKEKNVIKSESRDCCAFVLYDLMKTFVKDYEKFNWLVCAAMISDISYKKKENLEFIQKIYPEVTEDDDEIRNSEPGQIAQKIYSALIYFEDDLKKVYYWVFEGEIDKFEEINKKVNKTLANLIEEYKSNAEFYPDKNLYFYFFEKELNGKLVSVVSTKLSLKEQDKTFLVASYNTSKIKISARNQSGNVNVSDLLRKLTKGFESSTAGGHFKAAAASILKRDLGKFKGNLLSK